MIKFLETVANVKPSQRQLQWFELGFYAFVHFGVNTYTDREWGSGKEEPAIFNPVGLNCEQWVEDIKAAGMKGLILTAKHHDGFCLWPSKYTEHSVKNSPCKRDIVKEAAEACKKGGIKFGVYLSPWDRNSKYYGTEGYNDYYCNQLTELLTEYGELFCVWFDGACGEGPNGKKQEYDFERYINLVRKHQPNAVFFHDCGPDVRWCGNEAGIARYAEWAVVPKELCSFSEVQTGPGPLSAQGDLSYMYNTHKNVGSLDSILYSKGLVFAPAEIDMSIRPGWFWHEEEEPHSLERLFKTYITSVGGNACWNLNIPPNKDGLFDERDRKRLKEFGRLLVQEFGKAIDIDVKKISNEYIRQPKYEITLDIERDNLKYIVLREDISKGQRVESFQIEAVSEEGSRYPIYQGTTIGNRRICVVEDPFSGQNPLIRNIPFKLKKLVVHITSARSEVFLKEISVY